jgi:uncharacterized protein with PIN domain
MKAVKINWSATAQNSQVGSFHYVFEEVNCTSGVYRVVKLGTQGKVERYPDFANRGDAQAYVCGIGTKYSLMYVGNSK